VIRMFSRHALSFHHLLFQSLSKLSFLSPVNVGVSVPNAKLRGGLPVDGDKRGDE
jgi:hypothetical protein